MKTLLLMLTLQSYFTDELDSFSVTGDAPDLDSAVNKTDNTFLSPDGTMWVEVTNHQRLPQDACPLRMFLDPAPLHMQRKKLLKEVSCQHSYCSLITS